MAVHHAKLSCELREVVLKHKPVALLEVSPKGTVPVLDLGGSVLDESLDIMRYALDRPGSEWSSAELSHPLVARNDSEFKHYLDRYKYFDRFPEADQQWYFEQTQPFLDALNQAMVASVAGPFFLASPTMSALDAAIFPFVRQFALVDKTRFDALPLPALRSWFEHILVSSDFTDVMQKYPAWEPTQTVTLFD
ncbi:glutathione S-transferase [Arenicella chitinivorans]|uniref:Glutathione S-transferase n=2 Tax=Arenicella chitinivorans TaxID=1329800 RepID=A0A918RRL6_9GAMM|nr:glutathione S-transferase [Arenicella chitinivorans]